MEAAPRVGIVAIGSELTSGTRVNTNAAWLSRRLPALGLSVTLHVACPDDQEAIVRALRRTAGEVDVVLATGGLGPTSDDLTREAVAAALGVPLELDEGSLSTIEAIFRAFGRDMPPSNRKQALFPRGARVLRNGVGTAPAFAVDLPSVGRAVPLFSLPGVPREVHWLFEEHVVPALRGLGGAARAERVFRTVGIAESALGERLAPIETEPGVEVRYAAEDSSGTIEVRVLHADAARADALAARARELAGRDHVCAEGEATLAQAVGALLLARGLKTATAESCTGGRIAAALTALPGISEVFLEGIVAYSNAAKTRLLGVPEDLLARHGAVSAEVAAAMARGARERAGADVSVAVTGIAGPGGGSAEKPVGLVHMAAAGRDGVVRSLERRYPGDRELVQVRATAGALDLLRRTVLEA